MMVTISLNIKCHRRHTELCGLFSFTRKLDRPLIFIKNWKAFLSKSYFHAEIPGLPLNKQQPLFQNSSIELGPPMQNHLFCRKKKVDSQEKSETAAREGQEQPNSGRRRGLEMTRPGGGGRSSTVKYT